MRLVEQHVINRDDPRWQKIDEAAFASKNLYNAANYIIRQAFIFEHIYLDNVKVFHLIKHTSAYKTLPAKVSNLVLDQLHKNWKSYFASVKAYKEDPSKFLGHPTACQSTRTSRKGEIFSSTISKRLAKKS